MELLQHIRVGKIGMGPWECRVLDGPSRAQLGQPEGLGVVLITCNRPVPELQIRFLAFSVVADFLDGLRKGAASGIIACRAHHQAFGFQQATPVIAWQVDRHPVLGRAMPVVQRVMRFKASCSVS